VTILDVKGLRQSYTPGIHVLRDVSFKVEAGEFVGIIGSSGAGKSTLLRCINRLVEASAGRILVPQTLLTGQNGAAVDVLGLDGAGLRQLRRRIGMIFQQFNIVKRLSVIDNVLAGALGDQPVAPSTLRIFSRETQRRALANLERVGLLELAYKRAAELSGGEQQRVAIARTLMQRPAMILADEPVASLDPKLARLVLDILRRVCREDGITALVSLHTLELTREYADRVIGLNEGSVVFDAATERLSDREAEMVYRHHEVHDP
jgi:phosphonate transport system ATP-binding protein